MTDSRCLFRPLVWLLAAVLLLASLGAHASPVVSGLRLGENGSKTRFVIDIDARVEPEIFTLADPYRLVIDLPAARFQVDGQGSGKGRGVVARFRYGRFTKERSRIVLDLTAPARLERYFALPPQGRSRHRLVFDLVPTDRARFLADLRRPQKVAAKSPEPVAATPEPRHAERNGRRIIVVDAGHGGNDPGAPGAAGVPEKMITLGVAKEAARALEATGRYHAILTRDSDVYIGLKERVAIARRHKADLFVSLHADSLKNRRVRGATVYTLSETASDAEAAALAARENKADVLAGLDLEVEAPEVANILIDLAQRETMNYSARFANYLLPELSNRVILRRNSHRFAGFVVLKAPDVPSVLIEMGYMSNREDARFLGGQKGQREIAAALVAAVDRYFQAVAREQF